MKKGFTLIELLAVIIILAVVALIATPIVLDVVKDARESSAKSQAYMILDGAKLYHTESMFDDIKKAKLNGKTNIYDEITLSGKKPEGGKIYINEKGSIAMAVLINNKCYKKEFNNELQILASEECDVELIPKEEYVDNSGANKPELYDNMIPVIYENDNWIYANINNKWYDYDLKEWANAVVLKSGVTKSVGQVINIDTEVDLMFVWIPRYKYTIFNGNNESKPVQQIDVVFETGTESTGNISCTTVTAGSGTSSEDCGTVTNGSSTYTHPAFQFGSTSLTGFWVGKFETSAKTSCTATNNVAGTGCDLVNLGIQIKPNVTSWRGARAATFYTSIKNISGTYGLSNTDSHMIKNMEWGAVAYLKQSKYGLGSTDIGINNNDGYITGCGASAGSSSTSSCISYNTSTGMLASTTGNIYGVYDMSGGAYEYVMGNMEASSNVPMVGYQASNNYESNFKGLRYDGTYNTSGYDFPTSKYYDAYTYDGSTWAAHSRGKLGDATKETLQSYGASDGGWTSDFAVFPYSTTPWFLRGGRYGGGAVAGVFAFHSSSGNADTGYSARAVVSGV